MSNNSNLTKKSIYALFSGHVRANPNKCAISEGTRQLSYFELEQSVNNFSARLIKKGLIKPNRVAIFLLPSIDAIIVILSCLKLGLPYIPMETGYPDNYIINILEDARVKAVIISEMTNREIFLKYPHININETYPLEKDMMNCDPIEGCQNDDAYIIYTSGSTGSPKGVVIPQRNILNLINATQKIYRICSKDVIPLYHSLAFDFSVWEIYSALLNGAHLIIPSTEDKYSALDYRAFLVKSQITIVNFTPQVFLQFLAAYELNTNNSYYIRLFILGGEAFYPAKAKNWFNLPLSKNAQIYNMYGITEGTIHATALCIEPEMANHQDSPIGNALEGVKTGVFFETRHLEFANATGELCLGGLSIAKEYLNQPELNTSKFFEYGGERWFKTGDRVKQTDKGLIYLGRLDKLVKIRGFRVNCIEVENFLSAYEEISNVVVKTFQISDGSDRLVAFLQADKGLINLHKLRADIQRKLPYFMLPTKFVITEKFPLTRNGKIDILELEKLIHKSDSKNIIDNSNLEIQDMVIAAWKKTLGFANFGQDDNFFEVGGDSLLLGKLQHSLQALLSREIKIIDLLRFPTVSKFSSFLKSTG